MNDAKFKISADNGPVLREGSRSGQVYWMNKVDAIENFDSLNTRIESFTGFSTKTADQYQIVNYGLGGHYFPHHDTYKKVTVRNAIIYLYRFTYQPYLMLFLKYRLKVIE